MSISYTSQDNPSLEADANLDVSKYENDKWAEWYLDFLNLAFGNGTESKEFYRESVYPIIEQYYTYPAERLLKYELNYNALYYSFLFHCGIKVSEDRIAIQKFGTSEKPFTERNSIKCFTRSRVYQMRNLPVLNFSNKYKEYRSQGLTESSLQACKNKIHYTQMLEGIFDLEAQGEISEILVEEGLFDEAIEQAKTGLMNWDYENSSAIRFYLVLMRAYHGK